MQVAVDKEKQLQASFFHLQAAQVKCLFLCVTLIVIGYLSSIVRAGKVSNSKTILTVLFTLFVVFFLQ